MRLDTLDGRFLVGAEIATRSGRAWTDQKADDDEPEQSGKESLNQAAWSRAEHMVASKTSIPNRHPDKFGILAL
ncbi:MAG: hypothetical protein JO133_05610 [Burkholderiaceae bacterium]|nr:hypothetical protein [Burkholderiaceae bacterium]